MFADFDLTAFDAEFARRMPADDWSRLTRLRARPHFRDVIPAYHAIMSPLFVGHYVFNLLVSEAYRFKMLAFSLYLMDTFDPGDVRSGLTITRLQQICAQQELASNGRVATFINMLLDNNLAVRERSPLDARISHFHGTSELHALVARWEEAMFEVLAVVIPEAGLRAALARDPAAGHRMRLLASARPFGGWDPIAYFPEVELFCARDGGWTLLFGCMAAVAANGVLARPVALDLEEFGKTYGGSRSHLRRLLAMAHEQGLLAQPPGNGKNIVLSERMLCAFMAYTALYLENYAEAACEACGLNAAMPQIAAE